MKNSLKRTANAPENRQGPQKEIHLNQPPIFLVLLLVAAILHPLRLVVYPIIYRILAPSQVVSRISAINSMLLWGSLLVTKKTLKSSKDRPKSWIVFANLPPKFRGFRISDSKQSSPHKGTHHPYTRRKLTNVPCKFGPLETGTWISFQPSIFRGYVSFRRGVTSIHNKPF